MITFTAAGTALAIEALVEWAMVSEAMPRPVPNGLHMLAVTVLALEAEAAA